MLSFSTPLETLFGIPSHERASGSQAEIGHLVVSWAGDTHISICLRKEAMLDMGFDQVLSSLWLHQLHSLDEWEGIQIAANKYSNICFLYRVRDVAAPSLEQLKDVLRTVQYAMASVGIQY
jgi:hypothetical protein